MHTLQSQNPCHAEKAEIPVYPRFLSQDLRSAADHIRHMKNEMLFYKNAYEDNSQNALWQYMLEYFADGYTQIAKE